MTSQQDPTDSPSYFHRSSFDQGSDLTPPPNEESASSHRPLRLAGQEARNVGPLDYSLSREYPSRSSSNSGSGSLTSQIPFDYRSPSHRSNSPFPPPAHFLSSRAHSLPSSESSSSYHPYLPSGHTFSQSSRTTSLSPGGAGSYNDVYSSGINPAIPYNSPPHEYGGIPPPMNRSPYPSSLSSGLPSAVQPSLSGYSRSMSSSYHGTSYDAPSSSRRQQYPMMHPGYDPGMSHMPMPVASQTGHHHLWQGGGYHGSHMGYPPPGSSSLTGQNSLPRIDTALASSRHAAWSRAGPSSDNSSSISSSLRAHGDTVMSPSPIDSRDTGSPASSSSSSSVTFVPFQPGQPETSLLAHKITEDKSLSEDIINDLFPVSSQWQPPPSANNKPVGKKWICQWPGCKKPVRRQDRMAHALEHNGRKRFQCSCGHAFARTQDKRRHLREQATCRTCLRPVGRNGVDGICSACLADPSKPKKK